MEERLVSVVVPFLNEEACIPAFLKAIEAYGAEASFPLEIVFVDDGSTDRSCELLNAFAPTHTTMKLVRLSRNYGSHAAIRAGLSLATGACATFIGIDLQEPLPLIGRMVDELRAGHDVVCVQKAEVSVGKAEKMFSRLYSGLVRKYAVSSMPEGGCNSLMISRLVLDELNRHVESNSSLMMQILDMGYSTAYISCKYGERSGGASKWTLKKKIKLFIDSFIAFSYYPIRCISILGIVLAFLGLLYALVLLVSKLLHPEVLIQGWATLICICLVGFGLTNVSLGVIAEYLWRTLDAARNRPTFIIQSARTLGEGPSPEKETAL